MVCPTVHRDQTLQAVGSHVLESAVEEELVILHFTIIVSLCTWRMPNTLGVQILPFIIIWINQLLNDQFVALELGGTV